jgi:hypothetical protein
MNEYKKPGVFERVHGWFGGRAIRPSSIVDRYFLENLPGKIVEYKLATRENLAPIEKKLSEYEGDINELEKWRAESWSRVNDIKKKVERFELKFGVK